MEGTTQTDSHAPVNEAGTAPTATETPVDTPPGTAEAAPAAEAETPPPQGDDTAADDAAPPLAASQVQQLDIDRILHSANKTHRTAVKTLEAHEGIAVLPLSSWGTGKDVTVGGRAQA